MYRSQFWLRSQTFSSFIGAVKGKEPIQICLSILWVGIQKYTKREKTGMAAFLGDTKRSCLLSSCSIICIKWTAHLLFSEVEMEREVVLKRNWGTDSEAPLISKEPSTSKSIVDKHCPIVEQITSNYLPGPTGAFPSDLSLFKALSIV